MEAQVIAPLMMLPEEAWSPQERAFGDHGGAHSAEPLNWSCASAKRTLKLERDP